MKFLGRGNYSIIILCLIAMIVINFIMSDSTIKDIVTVIGFIIVLFTMIMAAIYRKGQKDR